MRERLAGVREVSAYNANLVLTNAIQTSDVSVNDRMIAVPMVLPITVFSRIFHCMKTNPQCSLIGCFERATNKHHIGGAGSPMIWVCRSCHGRIHGMEWHAGHSDLVKAGIAKARAEGRVGGNRRWRDPEYAKAQVARQREYHKRRILAGADEWLPFVLEVRPAMNWKDVARYVTERAGDKWTPERLRRTIMLLVSEGHVDKAVLDRAPLPSSTPARDHLIQVVKALVRNRTLAAVASELEKMGMRTLTGKTRWYPSSVAALLK